jgi:hypothetical protein
MIHIYQESIQDSDQAVQAIQAKNSSILTPHSNQKAKSYSRQLPTLELLNTPQRHTETLSTSPNWPISLLKLPAKAKSKLHADP